jgi:hypothetical protein
MKVFETISDVQKAIAEIGISKAQENEFDRYKFRGIDDVYNALAPILASHGLSILPVVQAFDHQQVQTSGGKPAIHTHVTVNYVITNREGDQCTATVIGEAQDRGDKGMNKAMSAAYKLLCFQLFCIPTEGGSHDSESESIQVDVQKVGEYEVATLREVLGKINGDESTFCGWQKIETIYDLPLDRFAKVMEQLNARLEQMSKEYAQGEVPVDNQGGTQ